MSKDTSKSPVIELTDIGFHYPNQTDVLKGFNFKLQQGERVGIIAPNGSGKTTLLHLIMGILKPVEGAVNIFGQTVQLEADFTLVRRKIGLLFQDADDQLFSPTVLEDVAFGPLNLGKSKSEAIEISISTLKFLGLEGFEDRMTTRLSGGEKRLVALATILAMQPMVLLLDEPTSGLDEKTKQRLVKVLNTLSISLVIVSHDFEFLDSVTDRINTIRDGQILKEDEFVMHSHAHSHPYGQQKHVH